MLMAETFLFVDLAKVAVISYFTDPSKNAGDISSNLSALQIYLSGFPTQEPYVHLRDVDWTCHDAGQDCGVYEANTQWRAVFTRLRSGKNTVEVPLWVLAPSRQQLRLRLFGLPATDTYTRVTRPPGS